jgi:hypothetical protein
MEKLPVELRMRINRELSTKDLSRIEQVSVIDRLILESQTQKIDRNLTDKEVEDLFFPDMLFKTFPRAHLTDPNSIIYDIKIKGRNLGEGLIKAILFGTITANFGIDFPHDVIFSFQGEIKILNEEFVLPLVIPYKNIISTYDIYQKNVLSDATFTRTKDSFIYETFKGQTIVNSKLKVKLYTDVR